MLAAMERLLGGQGTSIAARLALPPGTSRETTQIAITGLHSHWRRVAQNPLTNPTLARAAHTLQRTCEGLAQPPDPDSPTLHIPRPESF
jgi:hypothetical protein